MAQQGSGKRGSGGMTSALQLCCAVAALALPSAVLAFSTGFDPEVPNASKVAGDAGEFVPAEVDPRLTRSITVRALSKGRYFRFTPAATPSRVDASVMTVAVRLNANSLPQLALRRPNVVPEVSQGSSLAIAPTAYSLGTARGYSSFAQNTPKPAVSTAIRQLDAPDLASYRPRAGGATSSPSRLAPRIALDEKRKAGRSPQTFEQSDQQVDLGGSYRVSRNLNVTAGVRMTSDRDRLRPLTDGRQDSQAVYVGTQFRF